jgi:hypothetical protein
MRSLFASGCNFGIVQLHFLVRCLVYTEEMFVVSACLVVLTKYAPNER